MYHEDPPILSRCQSHGKCLLLDDNTAAHVSVSPPLATGTSAARDALSRSGDLGDLKSLHPETEITPPADSPLPRVS